MTRTEHDALGAVEVPRDALWGAHTQRAIANFDVGGLTLDQLPSLIAALARVKAAAASTNAGLGLVERRIADSITAASSEIAAGSHRSGFPLTVLQGGGGTSTNMNMNEVIANLGEESLGGVRGAYTIVRPLDHVNRSQSTNDVYPTALALATLEVGYQALERFAVLERALRKAAGAAPDAERLGRTCLQDAVPVPVGAGLVACASGIARTSAGLASALAQLLSIPLGATAVGSGIGAPAGFADHAVAALAELVGLALRPADDPFDALQNADPFLAVASELSRLWVVVSKLAADLRLQSSGPIGGIGEVTLPAVQAGSSIMPGKVNPVIPELVVLVGFEVSGARTVVEHAARGGELELNVMETAIAASLLPALEKSGRCAALFAERCIAGLTWNEERIRANLQGSLGERVLRATGSGHDADASLG